MKRVVILGSTGSIGKMALDVIANHRDQFAVVGLAAGRNIDLLEEQIRMFAPEVAAVADHKAALELEKRAGKKTKVYPGENGIKAVAALESADFVLSAMVGFSGLIPTIEAIRGGKVIGLANKETLVSAGGIVITEARSYGAKILPVDSEHSAIFQCLEGHDKRFLKKVILTASGGPFRGKKRDELKDVSPEKALKHPKWKMGRKITIDSATLMNKGLEVIEAAHLFDLPGERIDVLVHPQSIVHSLVEFSDGGLLAQVSMPDMRGPIAYALSYPRRLENLVPALDLADVESLTFYRPDLGNFPCLALAYDALKEGGTMLAVLNAANEASVEAFLQRRIDFNSIPDIINNVMRSHETKRAGSLDEVVEADRWAREKAEDLLRRHDA
jgi:1-deoxy-D-xylulose-5-phosphate reductoisomerase